MGQRFQIIISTPREYWNADNFNNKDRQYFIYHCQWLYGRNAVRFANRLIKALNKSIKFWVDWCSDEVPITASNYLNQSIQFSAYTFFPNPLKIFRYLGSNNAEDDKEYFSTCKNWKDATGQLDNNNGVLFVYIDDSFKVSSCFYNPKQAEKGIRAKSLKAREYINAYYSNKEISADKDFAKELRALMRADFIDLISVEYPRFGN